MSSLEYRDGLIESILYLHYVEHKGLEYISKELNHPFMKVVNFIKFVDIPQIDSIRIDEEVICRLYCDLNMSSRAVAAAVGKSQPYVTTILSSRGLTRNDRSLKSLATDKLIKDIIYTHMITPPNNIEIYSVDDRITSDHFLYEKVYSNNSLKILYGMHFGEQIKSKYICDNCGNEFDEYTYRMKDRKNVFCKPSCHHEWMETNQTGENNPHWQGKTKLMNCSYCGKEIKKEEWSVKDLGDVFCNRSCMAKWRTGDKNPNWKDAIKTVHCAHCGNELKRPRDKVERSEVFWCNKECESRWKRKNWKGENSPAWQGGSSFLPYCKKFNRDFKLSVRIFWDFKCALCGKHESEMQRALSIHHVHGDKEGSLCKEDSPREFVPLCDSCHGKTHARDKKQYYESLFTTMIQEKYDGACYCTPEEVEDYLNNN